MTKASYMIKIEVKAGIIRTSEVGTTLENTGIEVNIIEVIAETLRIETGHVTEVEARIEVIVEDLGGIEEIVDLGIVVDPTLGKN